jgi:hypothetical protein
VDGRATQELAKHRRHLERLFDRHAVMLREIGTFLAFRKKHGEFKDDFPIGIQTDDVFSQLNDMQFGSILDTLETCYVKALAISREHGIQANIRPPKAL